MSLISTSTTPMPTFVTEILELEVTDTPLASDDNHSHLVLLRSYSHTYVLDLIKRRISEVNPFSRRAQILMCILVGTICFLAIIANLIVCYIVLSDKKKKTAVNLFIVNLAVSDTLMAAIFIPGFFYPIRVLRYWPFSLLECKIYTFSFASSMLVGYVPDIFSPLTRNLNFIF